MSERLHRFGCIFFLCLLLSSSAAPVSAGSWDSDSPSSKEIYPHYPVYPNSITTHIVESTMGWMDVTEAHEYNITLAGVQFGEFHKFKLKYTMKDGNQVEASMPISYMYPSTDPSHVKYRVLLPPQPLPPHDIYGWVDAELICTCNLFGEVQELRRAGYQISTNSHIFLTAERLNLPSSVISPKSFVVNAISNFDTSVRVRVPFNSDYPIKGYEEGDSEFSMAWSPTSASSYNFNLVAMQSYTMTLSYLDRVPSAQYLANFDYIEIPVEFVYSSGLSEVQYVRYVVDSTPNKLEIWADDDAVNIGDTVRVMTRLSNTLTGETFDDVTVNLRLDSGSHGEIMPIGTGSAHSFIIPVSWGYGINVDVYASRQEPPLTSNTITISVVDAKPDTLDFSVTPTNIKYGQNVTFQNKLYNSAEPEELYDGYTVTLGVYQGLSQTWVYNVSSNQPLTVPFDFLPAGDYTARAVVFNYQHPQQTIASDEVPIHVSAPNKLDLTVTPTTLVHGGDIKFENHLYDTAHSTESYDGYTISLSVGSWTATFPSNTHLTVPFDFLPAGDYVAQAFLYNSQHQPLVSSNQVNVHVSGASLPDRLDLVASSASVSIGNSIEFMNSLRMGDDPQEYTGYDVDLYIDDSDGSNWYHHQVDSSSVHEVVFTGGSLTAGTYTAYAVCDDLDLESDSITITVLPASVLVVYPVPTSVPFEQIDRTNLTGFSPINWLIFTLISDLIANVDGILHDMVWGAGLPSPYQVFIWMRGSAGQVGLENVSATMNEQLAIEAQDDTQTNPLHFVVLGCQFVASTEHHFLQYILTLIRQNPFYAIQHDISVILTRIVPGFIWNVMAVFIFLTGTARIFKFYIDYR